MPTPINQLLSRTLYATDGTTTVWDFAFSGGYLLPAHVKAYTETPAGAQTAVTGVLTGTYQLSITPALVSGDTLVIYRDTPKDLPLVDFTDESGFSEIALDTNAKQAVFIAAEGADMLALTDISAAINAATVAANAATVAANAATVATAAAATAVLFASTSISAYGAIGDGVTDSTVAIQAALDSGAARVIVPAEGRYLITGELRVPANVILEGQSGARIVQDTYGLSGVQLRHNNSGVKNITFENLRAKAALSTTVANRYDGEVQRSRHSGVYVNAAYCTVENVSCPGFNNGVNLVGGERVWATTDGAFAATTLVLNASSAQVDDYYNGWVIRIFSAVDSTATVPVSAYDSATNTVTFSTVSTFAGPYYYSLIGPSHVGNRVYGYKGALNDFGILVQYQDDLTIDDIDQLSVEQTQELNARPHAVYVTAQVTNLRGSRWRTQHCPNGHAYKLRGVTGAVLTDLSARVSRAVLAIEESSKVFVDGCVGDDIGTADFRPESLNVLASADIHAKNIKLRVASAFDYAADTSVRPIALVIGESTYAPVTKSTFEQVSIECRGADLAVGVFLFTPVSGVHENITLNGVTTFGNGTHGGGATTPQLVRAFSVDNLNVQNLVHIGTDTPTVVLEASAVDSALGYASRLARPTVTNSGTNNKIIIDGEELGTFTPVVIGSTSAGVGTYTAQVGRFSKIGRRVFFQLRVIWTAHTGTGNLRLSGLPHASTSVANAWASCSLGNTSDIALTASNVLDAVVPSNGSNILFYQYPVGGGTSTVVPIDVAGTLNISGHYEAAA